MSLALFAVPAQGYIDGVCTASIDGSSLAGRAVDADNAIILKRGTSVPASGTSQVANDHVKVTLQYLGFDVATIVDEDFDRNGWSKPVSVDRYAKHGVGYYIVTAKTSACSAGALLKIEGNPLATTAGLVGAGLAGVGTAITVIHTLVGGDKPPVPEEIETPEDRADAQRRVMEQERLLAAGSIQSSCCGMFLLPAMMLTLFAMMSGDAMPRPLRYRWRPKITVLGSFSGLLIGLGTAILLQQYAILIPTRMNMLTVIGVGVLVPNVLVSLRSRGRIAKANRRLDALRAIAASAGPVPVLPLDEPPPPPSPFDTPPPPEDL
jgi:hypothetical protein